MAAGFNKNMTGEFASDDPVVDITRGFMGSSILLNEDKVLRSLGGNLDVYEDIYRDDRVKSCLQQRIAAVTSNDYDVRPGGDAPLDKKAAAAATQMIQSIRFDRLTEHFLLQALLKGYGIGEIIWSIRNQMIWPAAIKIKRSQRFTFAPLHSMQPKSNSFDEVRSSMRLERVLRLRTMRNLVEGEPVPERKFIVHSTGGMDDDNPYGIGLGFWLYWPVRFKREGMSLWLQFIDKFGSPSVKGTYRQTDDEAAKRKLLDALRALRSNSVTAIPEGMTAELIDAAKSGISTHEQLMERMDQAITTAILSQTLTTSQGNHGSQALGSVHEGIKDEVAKSDADSLSDTLNETLLYWFTEFNFPGAATPQIWRDMSAVEDLGAKAERDAKLATASGRNLDQAYVEDEYGVKLAAAAAGAPVPASFAEADAADAPDRSTDQLADQLETDAAPISDTMIGQVRDLLDECADLSEFSERLPELIGVMDTTRLAEVMAKAFATASLTGQFEVSQESK